AFAVHRGGDRETVLAVRRPEDDEDLPGHWGLPAASLREDEEWEEAVLRTGPEKLGVTLGVGPRMNEGRVE
ncbi:MAG: NUDIX domain-containing protein, partial [Gemmatimonadota bacterium]